MLNQLIFLGHVPGTNLYLSFYEIEVALELALLVIVKPEADAIEEMETHLIDQAMSLRLILGSEKHRSSKNALKSFDNATVMTAILGQAKEVEHLGGALEMDDSTFLLHSESRYPYRN